MTSATVEWPTPIALFDLLNREFGFTVDVASTHDNAKVVKHYTLEDDGLLQDWDGEVVWCNPPYGRGIADWVYKAATSDCTTVLLLPARVDVQWFHRMVIGRAEIRFIEGRVTFDGSSNPAPFPCMLVIYRNGRFSLPKAEDTPRSTVLLSPFQPRKKKNE